MVSTPFATGGSGTVSVRSEVLKDFEFPGKSGMDFEATCTDDIKDLFACDPGKIACARQLI